MICPLASLLCKLNAPIWWPEIRWSAQVRHWPLQEEFPNMGISLVYQGQVEILAVGLFQEGCALLGGDRKREISTCPAPVKRNKLQKEERGGEERREANFSLPVLSLSRREKPPLKAAEITSIRNKASRLKTTRNQESLVLRVPCGSTTTPISRTKEKSDGSCSRPSTSAGLWVPQPWDNAL